MRFSLRFQEVDVDKSCDNSDVALKSTKKWNFLNRKKTFKRYANHSSSYKSSSTWCPAAPTTQLDPPPANLATCYSKRKISKADLAADLTSSLKQRTQSETKLRQQISAKDTLL